MLPPMAYTIRTESPRFQRFPRLLHCLLLLLLLLLLLQHHLKLPLLLHPPDGLTPPRSVIDMFVFKDAEADICIAKFSGGRAESWS